MMEGEKRLPVAALPSLILHVTLNVVMTCRQPYLCSHINLRSRWTPIIAIASSRIQAGPCARRQKSRRTRDACPQCIARA